MCVIKLSSPDAASKFEVQYYFSAISVNLRHHMHYNLYTTYFRKALQHSRNSKQTYRFLQKRNFSVRQISHSYRQRYRHPSHPPQCVTLIHKRFNPPSNLRAPPIFPRSIQTQNITQKKYPLTKAAVVAGLFYYFAV